MPERTLAAWAAEKTLRLINTGCFNSVGKARRYMRRRSRVEDRPYRLPLRIYRSRVELTDYEGHSVIRFCAVGDAPRTVIYLHGGAYVQEISYFHICYCDNLCRSANVNVVVPLYKLAPNHTWEEAYNFLTSLYLSEQKKGKRIVMMGDSAGGGLAAAFVQHLSEQKIKLPEKVCLFSPWVDASMSSDYSDYVKKDPMLGVEGLAEMGRVWAGDLDPKDPKISPQYASIHDFPETLLFAGTREIFHPDIVSFHNKLLQAGIKTVLITGKGMNHVYPLYPIPEAGKARKAAVEFILKLTGPEESYPLTR